MELYEQIDVSQPSLSRRQVNALLEPVEDLEMIVVTPLETKMSFKKGAISNGKDMGRIVFQPLFLQGTCYFLQITTTFSRQLVTLNGGWLDQKISKNLRTIQVLEFLENSPR